MGEDLRTPCSLGFLLLQQEGSRWGPDIGCRICKQHKFITYRSCKFKTKGVTGFVSSKDLVSLSEILV